MVRAVLRAALLAVSTLLVCAPPPVRAQAPPSWTTLIPAGQYRMLAWTPRAPGGDTPLFVYLLRPAGAAAGSVRIFTADVVDLGVRGRDDLLAEIASRYAPSVPAHDVVAEPIASPAGVVAYVIRHREIAHTVALDGRGSLTLYVRSRAHAEGAGGGSGGGAGGM
jgi:hypothetical protein